MSFLLCLLTVAVSIYPSRSISSNKHSFFPFTHGIGKVAQNVGAVTITEYGQQVQRYVVSQQPTLVAAYGDNIAIKHNGGASIAKVAADNYSPDMYQEYVLLNRTFSFTADLSQIGCSCDAAITVVSMPGYGSNGQYDAGQYGTYYCDANKVNGVYCQEFDFMEANKFVTQTTPHKCDENAGGYISNCDGGGCATNSHNVDGNGLCPSSSCKINSAQPFRQDISFYGADQGYRIALTLTQSGKTFSFDVCNDQGYRQAMAQPFGYGMAIAMVYWGDSYNDMSWLDGMTGCQGNCPGTGNVVFSNITIGPIKN